MVFEAYRARIVSRLGGELFYVGFRVEEMVSGRMKKVWLFNGHGCGAPSPKGRGSISSWAKSIFKLVSEWKKRIRKM